MFSKLFSSNSEQRISWKPLTKEGQLKEVDDASDATPVLIFKHSTSCPISAMALSRFERSYKEEESGFIAYFLDLIAFRSISNEIQNRYGVVHESPQAILISKGASVYDASHNGIDYDEIAKIAGGLTRGS